MLNRFKELIDTYSSKEVSMADLRLIERSGLVRFDNQGISRSNKDCLLCVITCNELSRFKNELLSFKFDSCESYEKFILASGLDLKKDNVEGDYVSYKSSDGIYEIGCFIEENGVINIDSEDINLQESFNIYLRVQH